MSELYRRSSEAKPIYFTIYFIAKSSISDFPGNAKFCVSYIKTRIFVFGSAYRKLSSRA